MMADALAQVSTSEKQLPSDWGLLWGFRGREFSGEAMPDRAALIEAQIPGLRRFACSLLRGDVHAADDLVQDALERALSRWHLRRPDGNLRGWLYTILYNRFLTDQHRTKRRGRHDALTDETELPGIAGGQETALVHRDLLRAFSALPEEQRSVMLLIAVEDLSYREAARVLRVPVGTVMSRLSRARERLRQHMYGDPNEASPPRGARLRRVK